MKRFFSIGVALGALTLAVPAFAQSGTNVAPGQLPAAMNQAFFAANTDAVGYSDQSLTSVFVATGTTQATGAVIPTRVVMITTCAGGAGVVLPAVARYVAITVLNRSGATCLVYPSVGATVETSLGTNGSVNAAATVASNSDTIFRPVSATAWMQ